MSVERLQSLEGATTGTTTTGKVLDLKGQGGTHRCRDLTPSDGALEALGPLPSGYEILPEVHPSG